MNGKPFLIFKVLVILSVCFTLAYFSPKLKPTPVEAATWETVSIASFIFFLIEAMACIFVYGLVRGKDAYLRRDHLNILGLILLILELLQLTLPDNATFRSIGKARMLRILFLVQLGYQRYWEMKLIFQASVKCLPFMVVLTALIVLFFNWINIILIKLYKDQDYYCDCPFAAAKTKQQCFEWGGDWVK